MTPKIWWFYSGCKCTTNAQALTPHPLHQTPRWAPVTQLLLADRATTRQQTSVTMHSCNIIHPIAYSATWHLYTCMHARKGTSTTPGAAVWMQKAHVHKCLAGIDVEASHHPGLLKSNQQWTNQRLCGRLAIPCLLMCPSEGALLQAHAADGHINSTMQCMNALGVDSIPQMPLQSSAQALFLHRP